jgi:ribonuclease BN (tRNA processing enzyme)
VVHGPEGKVLVDCGHGVASLLPSLVNVADISAVVISHMHPDHFFDLVPLKYGINFLGLPPIPLCIPPGGTEVLRRLQEAVPLVDEFYEESYRVQEYDPKTPLTVAGIRIEFCSGQHFIPSWGMRFSLNGSGPALVYTADTAVSDPVRSFMSGARAALMEATLINHSGNTAQGHMTASEAGHLAREAGVGKLILTHVWKPIAQQILERASSTFGGETEIAESGKTFEI